MKCTGMVTARDEHHVFDVPTTASVLNEITSTIVGSAIRIHRELGPGLLEHAYVICLAWELRNEGMAIEVQKPIPLLYRNTRIRCAYRADIVVAGAVIVEVKAVEATAPIHLRQLHTYLKLARCPVGLLLNFGAPTMKGGIKRVVCGFPDDASRE